jgi:hypothetical protein
MDHKKMVVNSLNWLKIGNSAHVCYVFNQGLHHRHIS